MRSISWLKMDKMSDRMRQDGGNMRKMSDVSSVWGSLAAILSHLVAHLVDLKLSYAAHAPSVAPLSSS